MAMGSRTTLDPRELLKDHCDGIKKNNNKERERERERNMGGKRSFEISFFLPIHIFALFRGSIVSKWLTLYGKKCLLLCSTLIWITDDDK